MSKITINKLSFYYSDYYNPIFENVNLILDTDWRLGLIGRNGRGKSTFLKLLTGKLMPVKGNINMSVNMECFPYEPDKKYTIVMDIVKENIGRLKTMEDTMEEIIAASDESRYDEYCEIQLRYSELGGYEMEGRILKEMADMGLDEELAYREYSTLSGGERTRMMIIALFLRKNRFVLLDEPTNHLDIAGKEMVGEYLMKRKGFIVVSHDREGTANTQKYQFASNARTNGSQAYMRQAKHFEEQVVDDIEKKKQLLLNYEEAKELSLSQTAECDEELLIEAKKLSFAYSEGDNIINNFNMKLYKGDRIWIKGRNGAGKSTLLKLLSGEFNAGEAIEYAEKIKISVSSQEPLWTDGFIAEKYQLSEETAQYKRLLAFCDIFDLPDNFLKRPLETYSSGELKKIDIARALSEDNNVIFLDEPLNYMDVYFREQLERAILEYEPTIVFIEHDSRFGRNVSNRIVELSKK